MESEAKVLVVEDDPGLGTLISDSLVGSGFSCEISADGADGLQRALSGEFDLCILDINLPRISGLDICGEVKRQFPELPIIILTARGEEAEIVSGLEIGADDYLVKPTTPRELVARVRARLREQRRIKMRQLASGIAGGAAETAANSEMPVTKQVISFGELEIDLEKKRISKRGELLDLTPIEFDLIVYLVQRPGKPFERDELLRNVWGTIAESYWPNVNVLVCRLRKKLEDNPLSPRYLLTVRGRGYRFAEHSEL